MELLNRYLLGGIVPFLLMGVGFFYLLYLRGRPLLCVGRMVSALFHSGEGQGGVSPFRAVTLALAGTLGVGNIVGVASALALGGPGAIFWMWISALFAMMLKYAEIVLAMRHRRRTEQGKLYGSAMCYMEDSLASARLPRLGRWISALFALLCLLNALTMGSAIQSNAVGGALEGSFGVPKWISCLVLALLTFFVASRGSGRIMRVTEILVPWMSLGYFLLSVAVLILRASAVPDALLSIFRGAFGVQQVAGGATGFLLSSAIRYGTMRGLVSNEGGCGTAPTAHAGSRVRYAAEQGVFGVFEVFVDTVVLCTVTALVLLVSGGPLGEGDVMTTVEGYSRVLGAWAGRFLSVSVLCFGFATVICWAHYGLEAVRWLSEKKGARGFFLFFYSATVLIGGVMSTRTVWELADLAIGCMTVINLLFLWWRRGEVRLETDLYFAKKVVKN